MQKSSNQSAQCIKSFVRYNWSIFWLSWIFINTPKINLLHQFLLQIQPNLESWKQSGQTHFCDHAPHYIFQSTFNFYESVSTCKKSDFFIILRYSWFKNSAIWLAKSRIRFLLHENTAINTNFLYIPHSEKNND